MTIYSLDVLLFLFLLLSCRNCLYILEINPLLNHLQIFSPISRLPFCFICGFLYWEKYVWLSSICLFLFLFLLLSGDWPKNALAQFISENVLPILSSRSFMILCLVFEFIFVYGKRTCSDFIDKHTAQLSQHHLLKRISFFPIVYSCLLCQRLIDHRRVGQKLIFMLWAEKCKERVSGFLKTNSTICSKMICINTKID